MELGADMANKFPLVFIDTHFNGLVPAKIHGICCGAADDAVVLCLFVTADRGGYKRGDVIFAGGEKGSFPAQSIVPRDLVRRSRQHIGRSYVLAFTWKGEIAKRGLRFVDASQCW